MKTPENLLKRPAGVGLTALQVVGRDAPIDNQPIRIGDKVELKTEENVAISATVEAISGEWITGKINLIAELDGEAETAVGIAEDESINFREQNVLVCYRT